MNSGVQQKRPDLSGVEAQMAWKLGNSYFTRTHLLR
jgi:hypothetical protein